MARSGAVLGVGMIAAVGAGGMASAQDRPAAPISMPDPGRNAPAAPAAAFTDEAAHAGEVLRARIMQQAEHQQEAAEAAVQAAEARAAAERHHAMAAQQAALAEAEAKAKAAAAAQAAAARAAAAHAAAAAVPAQAAPAPQQTHQGHQTHQTHQAPHAAPQAHAGPQAHAAPQAPHRAPQQHRAPQPHRAPQAPSQARGSFTLPLTSYTLTAGFGRAGAMWSSHHHTGEDFAAPTGTPVRAVSGGTVTQAGWAGAYGYRVVLTLGDGTEVWYCHLSSMVITSGKVGPGTVIGRVGATGNVTGPHLHLEVRPGGGAPVDPLSWLRDRGLQP
ncbi:M23 family metallopeptidase [Streptomyces sp. NPDC049585]|uniref:M23 family metallopeptidase n=1 Tax=Streptomyces sp. NPDC049585 TaxID=3155154 RepID=UPI00341F50C8